MMRMRITQAILLCMVAQCAVLLAEDAKPPVTPPPPTPVPAADPTQPGDKLLLLLKGAEKPAPQPSTSAAVIADVKPADPVLPEMSLKALVVGADDESLALVEIKERGMLRVRERAEVSITCAGGETVRLTVVKIAADGVEFLEVARKRVFVAR